MRAIPLPYAMQAHADAPLAARRKVHQARGPRFLGYAKIVTIHAQPLQDCATLHFLP